MEFYFAAIALGMGLCSIGFGIYITLKIFNIPDITTDGSYTLGAAVTAALLSNGYSFAIVIPAVLISGALAGTATGLIHTRFKINALLAGILVMTALYSVNLSIMGRSNIPLINTPSIFSHHFISNDLSNTLLILSIIVFLLLSILTFILKTDFGIAMRATGSSETMIRALGVNTNTMKILGLAMANALTAFSGFLVCQYQQFADINMGIGIVIFGLGAVMIGETMMNLLKIKSIVLNLFSVIVGCIVFRLVIAWALSLGVDPNLLRLITSLIVLIIVVIPNIKKTN
jgi:putative tryptophan/tyrosine transport system permease protein